MTRSASYLSPQQMFALDLACKPIMEAFGDPPYLVGSVTETPNFRDVDVRLILDDDQYDRLIVRPEIRTLLSMAISSYLTSMSGLPIDFGIQRRTEANEQHPGKRRNPLGLRNLTDWTGDAPPAHRPEGGSDGSV